MLQDILKGYNVILASQSPRRQELIKGLDINFNIDVRSVEESYSNDLKREEVTNYLAKLKASAFDDLKDNDILITSDTIVWFEDKPLEKPSGIEEANLMLENLSGKKHEVFTSICLTSSQYQIVDYDLTNVYFKDLSSAEIKYYIDSYKPFDKAGSYGIQEWLGYIGVKKIEGSFVNVMGLPTHLLYGMLNEFVK